MVKSFQGVRMVEPKNSQAQPILVSDHMSINLITFHPDESIYHVIHVLTHKKISGAPVVDENQQLVGMISEGDCLKEIIRGKYNNTPKMSGSVKDYMTRKVITMDSEMTIFDAAQQFLDLRIRRFPVMKEGNLVGQISVSDVIRAMPKLKETTW